MRADQHKNKSSKSKFMYLLILVIVFVIGFIGYQAMSSNTPNKAKISSETSEEVVDGTNDSTVKFSKKELEQLSKAMDSISNLYTDEKLFDFKDDLTSEEVEKSKKEVDALSDKIVPKKELVDRIKEAQKFVKTKESK